MRTYEQDAAAAASLRRYAQASALTGDSSGTTQHWAGPTEDHLPERRPRNRLFARAVDYRTYRLRLTGPGYLTSSQHDKLIDTKKQVEGVMSADKFAGRNSILVLNFLYSFKSACDDCNVSEDQAIRLLKHFLVGSLQSVFLSYLGVMFDGSRRGIDSILSYPDAIYWLLLNYATETVLSEAFRNFQRMRQSTNETEEMFAQRVREEARLLVGVFDEAAVIAQFIDGVEPHVRYLLQERLNQNPNMSYQAITTAAQNYGDAARGRQTSGERSGTRRARDTRSTGALLAAADPSGDAPGYPLRELELGNVFRAEALAVGQLSRTPSRSANSRYDSRSSSPYRRERSQSPQASRDRYGEYLCFACRKPGHFLYDCPWLPENVRQMIREAHAAWARKQGRTVWEPRKPAIEAAEPSGKTAEVRFQEKATTAQPLPPVSILKPSDDPSVNPKKRPGAGLIGVSPRRTGEREMIAPRDLSVPAAFLTEDEGTSPISPGVIRVPDVHTFAAGFPNFKINACVGIERTRGEPVQVVLDTGAGPNLVREDFLPNGWEQHQRPLKVQFAKVDASGRRLPPQAAIPLVVRMGRTIMRATFFVVTRLAVPVLLGCAFIRQHVRAIFPGDDKVVLTSEESIPFAWQEPKRRPQRAGGGRSYVPRRPRRRKLKRHDRIKVARSRTIPPNERAAIWVTAPVKGTYLIMPRAEQLQRKGLALANGVADIAW